MVARAVDPGETDFLLLQAACLGDRAAHLTLFDRHAGLCIALARRLLAGRGDEAEEIVLGVFAGLHRSPPDAMPLPGTVESWLLSQVRRQCRGRADESPGGKRVRPAHLPPRGRAVDRAAVRAALASLPPDERRIIEHAYLDGLSCDAIAEAMETPRDLVRSRMSEGLRRLAEALR